MCAAQGATHTVCAPDKVVGEEAADAAGGHILADPPALVDDLGDFDLVAHRERELVRILCLVPKVHDHCDENHATAEGGKRVRPSRGRQPR